MLVARNEDVEERVIKMIEGLPAHGDVRLKPLMGGDRMIMLEISYAAGAGSPVHFLDNSSPHRCLWPVYQPLV